MLIDNPAEIKKHNSAVGAQVQMVNVQSYLDDAINKYLIPTVGYAQFNELVAAKPGAPTASQARVIDLLQKSAVGFMIYNWADQGAVQISNSGIHVSKSATLMPASDKKIIALKKQNIAAGYDNLELAVSFLDGNLADFPIYAVSEERHANRALLINTSAEFQAAGVFINQDARFYQRLRVTQADVEDTYIAPTLGESIKDALHVGILGYSLSEPQKALLKRVRKAIANFTMAEAMPYLSISMDANGIYELNETVGGISGNVENRTAADQKRMAQARYGLICKGESQMEVIRKYLAAHKDDFTYAVPDEVIINEAGSNVYFL